MNEIGPQYKHDHPFKAAARYHQSRYRADVLGVPFNEYGNRLKPKDARDLLIYYSELGVRESLRERYPKFYLERDGDLLRSEHIPFNMFGPFNRNDDLCRMVMSKALNLRIDVVNKVEFEYSPKPKEYYLDDYTAFDVYIECRRGNGKKTGIGIEVKYTELSYRIRGKEMLFVDDPNSSYWITSQQSELFNDPIDKSVASDQLRQIWRNHILGISMTLRGELDDFISVTFYPSGNSHFTKAIKNYRKFLKSESAMAVRPLTYEEYIQCIPNTIPYMDWKNYLQERYLFV